MTSIYYKTIEPYDNFQRTVAASEDVSENAPGALEEALKSD